MADTAVHPVDKAVKRVVTHADFAKTFRHPLKFNGTDFVEQRLSPEEQTAEITKLASKSLHVFLERYGAMLPTEDLRALSADPAAASAEVRFWMERLLCAPVSKATRQKQRRRRRWLWARQEMAQAEGFFSEEEMKRRDPSLFHQMVGRHLDSSMQLSAPMQGSLSGYLMQQLDKEVDAAAAAAHRSAPSRGSEDGQQAPKRMRTASCGAGADMEDEDADGGPELPRSADMEEEEEEDDDLGAEGGGAPNDVAVRRAHFLKAMRDRFINGGEPDFDYAVLDDDSELDDVVELGRDAEERYFDND